MTESLMTDQAATTTEGTPASQDASSTQPTGGEQQASQQQADGTCFLLLQFDAEQFDMAVQQSKEGGAQAPR